MIDYCKKLNSDNSKIELLFENNYDNDISLKSDKTKEDIANLNKFASIFN